jgi:hypothetical protein
MSRLWFVSLVSALVLSGCGDWAAVPLLAPSTNLPNRTPDVLPASPELTPVMSATETFTPTATVTLTPSPSPTLIPALAVKIRGCDTGFDITHQMGEVTNAYVTLSNNGGLDAAYVCATLSASDEGRQHPDKTRCVPSLPVGYQVTLKLTIDSKFRENTSIQVEVTREKGIPTLVANQSCRDIDLLKPNPNELGVLKPIQ